MGGKFFLYVNQRRDATSDRSCSLSASGAEISIRLKAAASDWIKGTRSFTCKRTVFFPQDPHGLRGVRKIFKLSKTKCVIRQGSCRGRQSCRLRGASPLTWFRKGRTSVGREGLEVPSAARAESGRSLFNAAI